jgi:putative peptide zinc metalloprotease protein
MAPTIHGIRGAEQQTRSDERPSGDAARSAPPTDSTRVPQRADGLDLLGELEGSGYEEAPCLVRRADGQTLQLTPLLYAVVEAIDGARDHTAIADEVSVRVGKKASPSDIEFLVEEKLRPLGVLVEPDGSQPKVEKANPLLALRWRIVVSDPEVTRRITAPFAALFWPPIVVTVVIGFAATVGWLLFERGLASGARQLFYEPELILLVFGLTVLSAGFHEFGHAAACRYGGGRPGAMGAGLYLVWPAFYTDVTDSYRLSRRARLRVDLGGLYFNMVFTLGILAAWAMTGWDALLIVIPLQLLQMVHQLVPVVRLDGYHILADITGVPDLFARIKPTLQGMLPGRSRDARAEALKPWVRAVVTGWVLLVIPLLLFSLVMMVVALPRLAATAWDSLEIRYRLLEQRIADADVVLVAIEVLAIGALLLPIVGTVYLLARLLRRVSGAVWTRTDGRPLARSGVVLAATAAAILVAWLLWPNGEYRPIHPSERGTFASGIAAIEQVPSGRPALTAEQEALLDQLPAAPPPSATDPGAPAPSTDAPATGSPAGGEAPPEAESPGPTESTGAAPPTTAPAPPSPTAATGTTTASVPR